MSEADRICRDYTYLRSWLYYNLPEHEYAVVLAKADELRRSKGGETPEAIRAVVDMYRREQKRVQEMGT